MGFQNPPNMGFQKWRVISKSINSKSFDLTNIEIELEIQIQSIPAKRTPPNRYVKTIEMYDKNNLQAGLRIYIIITTHITRTKKLQKEI